LLLLVGDFGSLKNGLCLGTTLLLNDMMDRLL
jgi:hypothetical protein